MTDDLAFKEIDDVLGDIGRVVANPFETAGDAHEFHEVYPLLGVLANPFFNENADSALGVVHFLVGG